LSTLAALRRATTIGGQRSAKKDQELKHVEDRNHECSETGWNLRGSSVLGDYAVARRGIDISM
jgi:hypothetical protein